MDMDNDVKSEIHTDLKKKFQTGTAIHQARNALNALLLISGHMQALHEKNSLCDEELDAGLTRMQDNIRKLGRILQNVPETEGPGDPAHFNHEVINGLKALAEATGISLQAEVIPASVFASPHPGRLILSLHFVILEILRIMNGSGTLHLRPAGSHAVELVLGGVDDNSATLLIKTHQQAIKNGALTIHNTSSGGMSLLVRPQYLEKEN